MIVGVVWCFRVVLLVVLVWLVFGLTGWVLCVLVGWIDLGVVCCGCLCLLLGCGFVGFMVMVLVLFRLVLLFVVFVC